ncbi:PCNA-associated factor [Gambusia affinis]|uniref:PCNA-associated factor n=1 Tax=Gambusia affinis TaxID=33528 RepID=UPI001CDD7128|nr:PCNA-associated factor [Gambusia affinis]
MVRTKADSVPASYRKAVAASAPRKSLGSSLANASSSSYGGHSSTLAKNKYAGGNPVCPRPTPIWQKGIGDFFGGPPRKLEKENQKPTESDEEEAGGSGVSKASRKARPLPSEDEEEDD